MGDKFDHGKKRAEHMSRRRAHGLTYEELGSQFGKAKSTAHRIINPKKKVKSMAKQAPDLAKTIVDRKIVAKNTKDIDKEDTGIGIKPKKNKKKIDLRKGYTSHGSAS